MMNANEHTTAEDLMDTLEITKIRRRDPSGGSWVKGTIGGHRFEALVFAEHAESEDYELERSRSTSICPPRPSRRRRWSRRCRSCRSWRSPTRALRPPRSR